MTRKGLRRARRTGVLWGLTALLAAGCGPADQALLHVRGETMGTFYSIKVPAAPGAQSTTALQAAVQQVLDGVDSRMSTWRSDSELSQLNRAAPDIWVPLSEDTVAVLQLAQSISVLSGGAFDVTVGPLVNLWGFGPDYRPEHIPTPDALAAAFQRVGYQHIDVDAQRGAARKAVDAYVDLSAIAKGYAVDLVAEMLEARGLQSYLVEVGGEVRARGRKPDGSHWRIAVEAPLTGVRQVQRVIAVDGVGVATSGDYRNYFEVEGKRYSHAIDPRTGRPITHALASVTVVDASTGRADALATALLVLGPEAGYALAAQHGIAAFFVIRDGDGWRERATPQFKPYLADAG